MRWTILIPVLFLAVVFAGFYGCWHLTGYLIEAGHLPGATLWAPQGTEIARGFQTAFLFFFAVTALSIALRLGVELPRIANKVKFWKVRGKDWPRE